MLHPWLVRRLFAVTYTYTEEPERHVKPTRHSRIRQGMTGSSSASFALTRLAQALLTKQQFFFLLLFFYFFRKRKNGKSLAHSQGNSEKVAFGVVWAEASVPEKPQCISIVTQRDRPVPLGPQGLQMHNFVSPTAHRYALYNLDHNTQYVVNPVASGF